MALRSIFSNERWQQWREWANFRIRKGQIRQRSILDVFRIDLASIVGEERNEVRTQPRGGDRNSRTLETPELGLFPTLEVGGAASGTRSFVFRNADPATVRMADLESFINTAYTIYGPDDAASSRGLFTEVDAQEVQRMLADPGNHFWPGRMWNSSPTREVPLSIGITPRGLEGLIVLPRAPAPGRQRDP